MKTVFLAILTTMLLAPTVQGQQTPATDSAQIRTALLSFYKWYSMHWKQFTGFRLYQSKKGKEAPFYVINWKEVDRYAAYIRSHAPHLGEAFIANERSELAAAEREFQQLAADEVPSAFNYDRFTGSQEEPKWFWAELQKKTNQWFINVRPAGTAFLNIQQPYTQEQPWATRHFFCGELKKESGRWKIARITCDLTTESSNNDLQ